MTIPFNQTGNYADLQALALRQVEATERIADAIETLQDSLLGITTAIETATSKREADAGLLRAEIDNLSRRVGR